MACGFFFELFVDKGSGRRLLVSQSFYLVNYCYKPPVAPDSLNPSFTYLLSALLQSASS